MALLVSNSFCASHSVSPELVIRQFRPRPDHCSPGPIVLLPDRRGLILGLQAVRFCSGTRMPSPCLEGRTRLRIVRKFQRHDDTVDECGSGMRPRSTRLRSRNLVAGGKLSGPPTHDLGFLTFAHHVSVRCYPPLRPNSAARNFCRGTQTTYSLVLDFIEAHQVSTMARLRAERSCGIICTGHRHGQSESCNGRSMPNGRCASSMRPVTLTCSIVRFALAC